MVDVFIVKLILSFLICGSYTIFSTVIADKLGSKIGGLINGLPSTVLFGLVFIAWTQSVQASIEATTLIPAVIGIACLFLITYVYFVKQNVWLAVFISTIVWSIFAYGLVAIHLTNFFISIMIFFVLFLVAYIFVTYIYKIKSVKGSKIVYSPQLLLVRGFISGFIVSLSIIMAKIGGPIIGGVFSAFPAMFSAGLLITYFAHGYAFSSAVAKSSLFAWISTLIFVIVARYIYLPFGIFWGTIISLLACYISALLLYNHIIRKHA